MTSEHIVSILGLAGLAACEWVDFDRRADDDEDDDDDATGGDADSDADADIEADIEADTDTDGGADADAGAEGDSCDAIACDVAPDPVCLDAARLRTFVAPGLCHDGACQFSTSDSDCGTVGCCADHCCDVVPSNAAAVGRIGTDAPDVQARDADFDTALDCHGGSILGDCARVAQPDAPDVCVCRVGGLELGSLDISGDAALAILAAGRVTIDGVLSLAADHSLRGAGGAMQYLESGRAGGSYSTLGGSGAAAVWGNEALEPLAGGMDGQDSCGAAGGGGGGAVQITSNVSITVTGALHAGGGGGGGGTGAGCSVYYEGAGGGSGGAILLEAPVVRMDGVAAANGGGGGGGGGSGEGAGWPGSNASATDTSASGGSSNDGGGCALHGYTNGGWGGAGAARGSNGADGGRSDSVVGCLSENEYVGGGGGGGGEGRIRINTIDPCACDGLFSPAATFGAVVLE